MMKNHHVLFIVVGIANTAIDFVLLNFFTAVLDIERLLANFISVTLVITFSYYANKRLVFDSEKNSAKQAINFAAVSLITAYIVQTGVIYFMTDVWTLPLETAKTIVDDLELNMSEGFVFTNGAKAAAVSLTAIANYFGYKYIVFKTHIS